MLMFKGLGKEVASIYRAEFSVLLPVAAVVFTVPAIFNHLPLPPLLVFPAAYPIQTAAMMVYAGIVAQRRSIARRGEMRRISDTKSMIAPRFTRLVSAGILLGFATVAGVLCLVIPGLVIATMWFVAAPLIALDNLGVVSGFRASWRLVRLRLGSMFVITVGTNLLAYGVWWLVVPGAADHGRLIGMAGSELSYVLTAPPVAVIIWCAYERLQSIWARAGEWGPVGSS